MMHMFLYVRHALLVYSDDTEKSVVDITFTLVPQDKLDKLSSGIRDLISRDRVDKRTAYSMDPGLRELPFLWDPSFFLFAMLTLGLARIAKVPLASPIEAAADAMASGDCFAIGGYVNLPSGHNLWFSQSWVMSDSSFAGLDLSNDAQSYIASWETLAQIALLHCVSAAVPFGRLRVRIKSWSDNAGAESISNKLYTRKFPLCIFAQRLALFSAYSSMTLDVSHIPGEYNDDADMLSRITDFSALPSRFSLDRRLVLDLQQLWFRRKAISLSPPDFSLPWDLPTN
ncbi:unnamed protein product, partial [Symbiodinium sp. CCMP2456]